MRITNLKMQAYRGIGDLEINFNNQGPTILFGLNGSGKSSILDCISSLLMAFVHGLFGKDDAGEKIFNEKDLTLLKDAATLRNEITILYAITEARANGRENSENVTNEHSITFSGGLTFPNKTEGYPRNDFGDLNSIVLRTRNQLRTNKQFNLPIIVSYSVQRSFNSEVTDNSIDISPTNYQQLEAYEESLSKKQVDFASFFNWFKYREDIENEKRLSDNPKYRDSQLEAVRTAVHRFLPDFKELRIRRLPLRMTVVKQEKELAVDQLSDGEKCILAMVGDLARRLALANPGLSNPLEGTGIVLIDEIELHLHPQWQRGIVPSFTRAFPNCQFIVTTHSPLVISDIPTNGIYSLEATESGVSAKHPELSYGRDSNQILEVMGVSERPEEIQNELRHLFRAIDAGDLTEAKSRQKYLENLIGDSDPEFAKADILIRRKEVLGR